MPEQNASIGRSGPNRRQVMTPSLHAWHEDAPRNTGQTPTDRDRGPG